MVSDLKSILDSKLENFESNIELQVSEGYENKESYENKLKKESIEYKKLNKKLMGLELHRERRKDCSENDVNRNDNDSGKDDDVLGGKDKDGDKDRGSGGSGWWSTSSDSTGKYRTRHKNTCYDICHGDLYCVANKINKSVKLMVDKLGPIVYCSYLEKFEFGGINGEIKTKQDVDIAFEKLNTWKDEFQELSELRKEFTGENIQISFYLARDGIVLVSNNKELVSIHTANYINKDDVEEELGKGKEEEELGKEGEVELENVAHVALLDFEFIDKKGYKILDKDGRSNFPDSEEIKFIEKLVYWRIDEDVSDYMFTDHYKERKVLHIGLYGEKYRDRKRHIACAKIENVDGITHYAQTKRRKKIDEQEAEKLNDCVYKEVDDKSVLYGIIEKSKCIPKYVTFDEFEQLVNNINQDWDWYIEQWEEYFGAWDKWIDDAFVCKNYYVTDNITPCNNSEMFGGIA